MLALERARNINGRSEYSIRNRLEHRMEDRNTVCPSEIVWNIEWKIGIFPSEFVWNIEWNIE